MPPSDKNLKIFIGAGEVSSDFLGAEVIKALQKKCKNLICFGIGGKEIKKAGNFKSLFPMEELSLMGFFEILPTALKLLWRIHKTAKLILKEKPDVVLTIDAGEFYFRLHKKLRKKDKNIKLMHLNAPSVWAIKPGRAKMVAGFLNHLFALFPFEPPYFTKYNLPTTFVGHPLANIEERIIDLHLPKDITPITVLFGSRNQEVQTLSDDFIKACTLLQKDIPNLFLLIPTFDKFHPLLKEKLDKTSLPYRFLSSEEKFSGFKASRAVLSASGTVALELAKAEVPFTIAYKLNPLTFLLARLLIKTPFACLVNILLKHEVIREYLQKDCTPENLYSEMKRLLTLSEVDQELLICELRKAYHMLQCSKGKSAEVIAKIICDEA